MLEEWNNNRKVLWDAAYTCGKEEGGVGCPYSDFMQCYEYVILEVPSEGEPGYEAWSGMKAGHEENNEDFPFDLGHVGRICNTEQGMDDTAYYFSETLHVFASVYEVGNSALKIGASVALAASVAMMF